jgi:hypothetical protein
LSVATFDCQIFFYFGSAITIITNSHDKSNIAGGIGGRNPAAVRKVSPVREAKEGSTDSAGPEVVRIVVAIAVGRYTRKRKGLQRICMT